MNGSTAAKGSLVFVSKQMRQSAIGIRKSRHILRQSFQSTLVVGQKHTLPAAVCFQRIDTKPANGRTPIYCRVLAAYSILSRLLFQLEVFVPATSWMNVSAKRSSLTVDFDSGVSSVPSSRADVYMNISSTLFRPSLLNYINLKVSSLDLNAS